MRLEQLAQPEVQGDEISEISSAQFFRPVRLA